MQRMAPQAIRSFSAGQITVFTFQVVDDLQRARKERKSGHKAGYHSDDTLVTYLSPRVYQLLESPCSEVSRSTKRLKKIREKERRLAVTAKR
jgi:hypothetical protein